MASYRGYLGSSGQGLQHLYHPKLDGLRALAALMVMIFHLSQAGLHIPGPVTFGQTGVDLFFVLSGFLITSILLRARHGDWAEVKTFYLRRSLRIFPLYFGYLMLFVLISGFPSWQYWMYLQNFANAWNIPLVGPTHLWSLAVEEHFYLIWPFLVLFSPRRWLVPILWAMIAGSALLRLVLVPQHVSVFPLTFTRLDGLAAGSLLAVAYSRNGIKFPRRLQAGAFISAVLMVGIGLAFRNDGSPWFAMVKYSLITALYTCVVGMLLVGAGSDVGAFLASRWMRFVGRVSYGLYVFHPPVFAFCFARMNGFPSFAKAITGVAVALLVSVVSWYGFERHFIELKSRWAPEPRRTPRAPITFGLKGEVALVETGQE